MPTDSQTLQLALRHHRKNELDRAEALYREALAQSPGHADALGMLGQLLLQTRRADEGIALLRRAIDGKPREPVFYAALGQALAETGDLDGAIAAQRRAAELAPAMAAVHYNLGLSLKNRGRLQEARASLDTAIRLQPGFAQAHNNLGNVLQALGRGDEAISAYHAAVRLAPADPVAHNNLGNARKDAGLLENAESHYREALRLKPDFAQAASNLADALFLSGRHDEALEQARQARNLAPHNAVIHSNFLTMLLFHPETNPARERAELEAWRGRFAEPLKPSILPHANDRSPERRLRIGYVSSDFRDHVVGRNLIPLFRHHDRTQFDVFCYSGVARPDAISEKFHALASRTVSTVGMSDERLSAAIRADGIDILVDLALHMSGGRLLTFARKPAPVQFTFAGYPGSTGLDTIDCRLTDPRLDPPGESDAACAEASIRIPTFWCYDPIEDPPAVGELPAMKAGHVTFACLNNFCKVNDRMLALWARIMTATPDSRLILLAGEGSHRARVLGFMLRRGIAPEQMRFYSKLPRPAYLDLYRQVDIALDTLPYNGHTTSLDALFMGVPVVTLPGKTVVGRAGLSQLSNLGMPELIAGSPEDYVRIASDLARDLSRLAALRAGLRERMTASPLMDAPAFARSIETAYREMWRRWCAG